MTASFEQFEKCFGWTEDAVKNKSLRLSINNGRLKLILFLLLLCKTKDQKEMENNTLIFREKVHIHSSEIQFIKKKLHILYEVYHKSL